MKDHWVRHRSTASERVAIEVLVELFNLGKVPSPAPAVRKVSPIREEPSDSNSGDLAGGLAYRTVIFLGEEGLDSKWRVIMRVHTLTTYGKVASDAQWYVSVVKIETKEGVFHFGRDFGQPPWFPIVDGKAVRSQPPPHLR